MRGEVSTIRPAVAKPRGDGEWFAQSAEYYVACPELAERDNPDVHRDVSGTIGSGQETWMQTTVEGPGNVSFYYKMSSVSGDALAFYIDTNIAASWGQGSSWNWTGNFAVPSGTHTLKWKYYKYSGSTAGSCWVDAIQWSGGAPASGGGADWEQITYTYDPSGRRIAKDVDGEATKYVYDGDHCIAEYDANDVQLRKYVYGPGIDQPICMIEVADANAAYFYHYDGLGSVVALSDADGDTVQVYEYDVYGQVAASDPNHTNPFMFTGRRFDTETGLYYCRARDYNPTIGRFLQTDPARDGTNLYAYCLNNPMRFADPSGEYPVDTIFATPLYRGQESFSGPWKVGGSIHAVTLIRHYFEGNGVGLWFCGGHAGDLLKEAARQTVRQWLINHAANWSMNWMFPDWPIAMYAGQVQFVTSGWRGYATALTYVFDDPAIKNLLGGGKLYGDGFFTSVWAGKPYKGHCTITVKARFSFYDVANFHPDQYDEDRIGEYLERMWNGCMETAEALNTMSLPQVEIVYAQPYSIMIDTEWITMTVVYDADTGRSWVTSEWP